MKAKLLLVVFTLFLALSPARAEVSPEKRAEIDRMLKLTGMERLMEQMIGQMLSALRTQSAEVPEAVWAKITKKIQVSELVEMIVPLYDKYYSLEDLRAVNAFYSSPVGQRVISTLPQIMQESQVLGQQWGEKVGQRAFEELAAEAKAAEAKASTLKPTQGTPTK